MYRAVTIPQAMKLNAMLTKKQSCDMIVSERGGTQRYHGVAQLWYYAVPHVKSD
jgi:lipoate-protein ligase B